VSELQQSTVELPVTKFGMGDYIRDITPQAKIQSSCSSEVSRQMGEKYLCMFFSFISIFVTPVFAHIPRLTDRIDLLLFNV